MTEGILLVDKPKGVTSFSLVRALRRHLNVSKIGHAGTLDPMATGLMVMLIGKKYTQMSAQFLETEKEYEAEMTLGYATDTFDADGQVLARSSTIPSLLDVEAALTLFQGQTEQTPPMFSAKKINGKKLCDLARQGITLERKKHPVEMHLTLLSYTYPLLKLHIRCSKGTYIRSLAHDLGEKLGSLATLTALRRTKSGFFTLDNSFDGHMLFETEETDTAQTIKSFLTHGTLPYSKNKSTDTLVDNYRR
jgi:tRNA pseudouridine55 synthase